VSSYSSQTATWDASFSRCFSQAGVWVERHDKHFKPDTPDSEWIADTFG
jgi:hypothetical protein